MPSTLPTLTANVAGQAGKPGADIIPSPVADGLPGMPVLPQMDLSAWPAAGTQPMDGVALPQIPQLFVANQVGAPGWAAPTCSCAECNGGPCQATACSMMWFVRARPTTGLSVTPLLLPPVSSCLPAGRCSGWCSGRSGRRRRRHADAHAADAVAAACRPAALVHALPAGADCVGHSRGDDGSRAGRCSRNGGPALGCDRPDHGGLAGWHAATASCHHACGRGCGGGQGPGRGHSCCGAGSQGCGGEMKAVAAAALRLCCRLCARASCAAPQLTQCFCVNFLAHAFAASLVCSRRSRRGHGGGLCAGQPALQQQR